MTLDNIQDEPLLQPGDQHLASHDAAVLVQAQAQVQVQVQALPGPEDARAVRLAIAGIMLALTLASLDGNIVGPALPHIVSDLGGLSHLSWVVTGFAVASTASTPLYGKLSDQFGRRPAFFVSIGLFLLGSVLCGAAHSMTQLIGARAVQGAGAGGLIALSQTAIADLVSPRERGRYQGMVAAVFAACSVAGPLIGGIITDQLSWPWIFYINLPVGAAALAILAISLKPQRRHSNRGIDLAGFTLLIAGTCSGLLALSWGGTIYPWLSLPVLAPGTAAILMFALLIPVERHAREPALPPRLFRNPVFVRGVAGVSLCTMAMFGAIVFIPLFFQLVLGESATEAGLRMAPMMGGLIVSSVIGGRLVSSTGRYKIFPVIGLALGTLGFVGMAAAARAHAGANIFDVLLVALGLGMGLVMPNITTAIQNAVAIADLGVATATAAFFRSLGGAFGVAVAGTILAGTLHTAQPQGDTANLGLSQLRALPPALQAEVTGAYAHALSAMFAMAAICMLLAFAIVLFLPEIPLRGAEARKANH
jgi:EmrB/QacA subfamily drug resistance transporter